MRPATEDISAMNYRRTPATSRVGTLRASVRSTDVRNVEYASCTGPTHQSSDSPVKVNAASRQRQRVETGFPSESGSRLATVRLQNALFPSPVRKTTKATTHCGSGLYV